MNTIHFKQNMTTGVTIIKNIFIDHYMINAHGEYVKIYLYILRCLEDSLFSASMSLADFADIFDCTEKDILRALKYWENTGLITMTFENDILTSIQVNDLPNEIYNEQETSITQVSTVTATKIDSASAISSQRLSELIHDDKIKELLFIAQTYLQKTLSPQETNILLYFYETLKFSPELIEYLLEYCANNNHRNLRYIEKIGLTWHNEGIETVAQAKDFTTNYSKTYFSIMKTFGVSNRNPAPAEKEFIEKWSKTWGFSLDLILEACNRTIATIQQPSFKYADSILEKWHQKGVKNRNDIQQLDNIHKENQKKYAKPQPAPAQKKTGFNNFPQQNYNLDELEQALLNRNRS